MSQAQTIYAQNRVIIKSEEIDIDSKGDNNSFFINGVPWGDATPIEPVYGTFRATIQCLGSGGSFSGTATQGTGFPATITDGHIELDFVTVDVWGKLVQLIIPTWTCTEMTPGSQNGWKITNIENTNTDPDETFPLPVPVSAQRTEIFFVNEGALEPVPGMVLFSGGEVSTDFNVTLAEPIGTQGSICIFYYTS